MLTLSSPRLTFLSRALISAVALSLVTLAGCDWNQVETGRNGQIELIPDDCGKLGCDLDDGIAVGGTLDVSLRGTDGRSADDLTLVSSAPWVVQVIGPASSGGEPRFEIVGMGGGRADLIAIDRYGYEVDYLPVEVAAISDLAIDASAAELTELTVAGFDEAFATPAGAELTIDVAALALGRELTGAVSYRITLDPALSAALVTGSDVRRGHLTLRVPAGDHALDVTASSGAHKRVRVSGQ